MKPSRRALVAVATTLAAVAVAAPAQADPDIDFADQLHGFGIYGARDYNAWLGKITCKRLYKGVEEPSTRQQPDSGVAVPRRGGHHLLPRPGRRAAERRAVARP